MSVSQVIPASLATLNRGSHVSGDTCHMMPFCTARRAAFEGPHRAGVDPVRPAVQPGGSGGPLPSGCRGPAPTPMGAALPSGGIRPDGSDGFGRPGPDAPRSSLLPESQLCAARGVGAAWRQRRPLGRRNRNVPAPLAPRRPSGHSGRTRPATGADGRRARRDGAGAARARRTVLRGADLARQPRSAPAAANARRPADRGARQPARVTAALPHPGRGPGTCTGRSPRFAAAPGARTGGERARRPAPRPATRRPR